MSFDIRAAVIDAVQAAGHITPERAQELREEPKCYVCQGGNDIWFTCCAACDEHFN